MKKWEDVKNAMTSLSNEEKQNIEVLSDIVSHMIERRHEIGLSQRDLAQRCGIKQSAIARLEPMKTVLQIDTLSKLMKPLGLKLTVVNDENFAHQHYFLGSLFCYRNGVSGTKLILKIFRGEIMSDYTFKGRVICGLCGRKMRGKPDRKRKYRYVPSTIKIIHIRKR